MPKVFSLGRDGELGGDGPNRDRIAAQPDQDRSGDAPDGTRMEGTRLAGGREADPDLLDRLPPIDYSRSSMDEGDGWQLAE